MSKPDNKKFLELKLHESLTIDDTTVVLKVPGGYIYKFYSKSFFPRYATFNYELCSTQFVPEDRKTSW